MANLADLKIGEKGEIVGFTDDSLSLKLLEMGCLPGTEVVLTHLAPFGDPIAIRVSGSYTLSMRREEAETMLIKRT
jgi:ferrous iron transport protein A